MTLATVDPLLWQAIANEAKRQREHLELIASENYVSRAVLEAQGSILTNKYAEGYPGRRYYGGCEFVDVAESLAIDRAKQLFAADYVNVQPHSGAQANLAVLAALMQPGDTLLGMSLNSGGHLTHGTKMNASGKLYNAVQYGISAQSELIDYDEVRDLALKHRPKVIVAGFSAYARILDWARFRAIADEVGAFLWADMAHVAGLVAAKQYPSPLPHAHVVTSTTHKTLRGPRGGLILSQGQEGLSKKLNSAIFPGTQGGPLMHVIAAKAVSFLEALQPAFIDYQKQVIVNAKAMAEVIMARGFPLVTGGTDNHLLLIKLIDKGITGATAETALGKAHITVNKNAIVNDPQPPMITSGVRIGSPAITSRGLVAAYCRQVAHWLCDGMEHADNEAKLAAIGQEVREFLRAFPLPAN
jgi:glycine hydroxymethyltransferase